MCKILAALAALAVLGTAGLPATADIALQRPGIEKADPSDEVSAQRRRYARPYRHYYRTWRRYPYGYYRPYYYRRYSYPPYYYRPYYGPYPYYYRPYPYGYYPPPPPPFPFFPFFGPW